MHDINIHNYSRGKTPIVERQGSLYLLCPCGSYSPANALQFLIFFVWMTLIIECTIQ